MLSVERLKEFLADGNVTAFLDTISHSEGTPGEDGYRMLFGGKLVDSLADHPHIFFSYKNKAGEVIKTSAFGKYQITYTTWKVLKERLNLPDCSPESQDLAALELIREAGALYQVKGGYIDAAIEKCRHIWASLPGAGAHQPEHSIAECERWYEDAGGQLLSGFGLVQAAGAIAS